MKDHSKPSEPDMNADDRLIDTLLREHARAGKGKDEVFLKRLESAIADESSKTVTPFRRASSRRWARPLGLAATVALAAFATWMVLPPADSGHIAGEPDPYKDKEMVPLRTEVPRELSVGTPKDLSYLMTQRGEGETKRPAPEVASAPPPPPTLSLPTVSQTTTTPPADLLAANDPKPGRKDLDSRRKGDAFSLPAPAEVAELGPPGRDEAREVVGRAGCGGVLGGMPGLDKARAGDMNGMGFGAGFAPRNRMILPQEESGFDHHPPPHPMPSPAPVDRERYGQLVDNPWRSPADEVFSTFSIDVDTASYANFRRLALTGARIPADAVRLEEMVNYFDYAYPQPTDGLPFGVGVDSAICPWNPDTRLVRVALQGREVIRTERVPANLVFLLDVSGSMNEENKLPLVAKSFQLLLEEMNAADTVSIVVYAGSEGMALPPTKCDTTGREKIDAALKNLRAGGSTNGGAGIQLAYKLAKENFKEGGINRVILATDGDFNVGVTEDGGLISLVEKNAKSNVFLTVLGFGTGNINDGMLEAITNKGNGTYHYIDSLNEGRRVFLQKMMGTLLTIAKDVKIQVEFNPAMVAEYRLLGYANRMLNKEDFNNDRVDAGDIGAGHTVTAFYEIKPGPARAKVDAPRYRNPVADAAAPAPAPAAAEAPPVNPKEWLTVKLRYKEPDGDTSKLIERPFAGEDKAFSETGEDFRFATAVAMTASILRETGDFGQADLRQARDMATGAKGNDPHGLRAEFVSLLERLLAKEDENPRR